jgi:hypothetical protein
LEVNTFALDVAKTFLDCPLFGIDVIRDNETHKLYVLEASIGGNTWHFSSEIAKRDGLTPLHKRQSFNNITLGMLRLLH